MHQLKADGKDERQDDVLVRAISSAIYINEVAYAPLCVIVVLYVSETIYLWILF